MTNPWRRVAPTLIRTTTAVALAAGSLTFVASMQAQAADPVTIQLLGINDFHGRIDTAITPTFATTIEQLRQGDGASGANTALVGAGDLIGASLFASASQEDEPTIDVLNALGLDASAVGNHEFDQGFADLTTRVIPRAQWKYLGSNVYDKGTEDPALDESVILDVNGVKVGVVGAVTDETPTLVSPDGVADLDFGDPVAGVNRAAAAIEDLVDVTVATYHEGAATGATYAEALAAGGAFADIVEDTDPSVDAIFTGHTHRAYAFDAPVPGVAGKTRPVLQTGQYADNVGKVTLTVDTGTDDVSAYTMQNVPRVATADTTLPVVQTVKAITDAAVAEAAAIGNEPVGEVTQDITRAFTAANAEDRGAESTIGNLVANALRDSLAPTPGGADLGLVNPGGLRTDLLYAGNTATNPLNTDGVITYAEANGVLPFVNNLGTITLTGEDLKEALEQQWQPAGAQRPFLHLGLSDNVQTTFDPTKPEGSRITSVLINGEPLDPAGSYKVATFSFLRAGGDNFTALMQGTYADSGLIDRDAWIDYLRANKPVAPSFARRQVQESGLPATVAAGDDVAFTLSKLNLTSKGSPVNTDVSVYLRPVGGGERIFVDTYDVEPAGGGSASIAFTAPDDLVGDYTVVAVASPTGTTVGRGLSASTLTATAAEARYGIAPSINVDVASTPAASGEVKIYNGFTPIATGTIEAGTGVVKLGNTSLVPGTYTLTVKYTGFGDVAASQGTVTLTVVKATSNITATSEPSAVRVNKTSVKVRATVSTPGFVTTGRVEVRSDGQVVGSGVLTNGTAVMTLKKFKTTGNKTLVVSYLGSSLAEASVTTIDIRVVK